MQLLEINLSCSWLQYQEASSGKKLKRTFVSTEILKTSKAAALNYCAADVALHKGPKILCVVECRAFGLAWVDLSLGGSVPRFVCAAVVLLVRLFVLRRLLAPPNE